MYITNDFLKLTTDELSNYTAKGFALCYVETSAQLSITNKYEEYSHRGLRMFFTDADLSKQWGDDWDDAPYNLNAGWPDDKTFTSDGKDGWIKHEHTILVLNVTLPNEHYPQLPEDWHYNVPFTVEMINQGACAWIFFGAECKPIYAGATPLDVFEKIGRWMHECPEIGDETGEC